MNEDMNPNVFATKADLTVFSTKEELRAEFVPLRGQLHRLSRGYVQLQGDVTDIKRDVRELFEVKAELISLKGMIVGLAASVEASLRKHVYQGDMLMEHETRLKAVERKTP